MQYLPKEATKIELENTTVDFYKYNENNITYYYFDTSLVPAPEPMVNAMIGLQLVDDNTKLVMINHKPPIALFPKIQKNYSYDINELDRETYKIIFSYKKGTIQKTNFSENNCLG